MVITIKARGVNDALNTFIRLLDQGEGVAQVSPRGKDTLEFDAPVVTTYTGPWERVLFSPERDANPFFHLMEALWMLAGRNDVGFVSEFNSQIAQFSDDGWTLSGSAYGKQWAREVVPGSGVTQLDNVVALLKRDPDSRRAVITMWGDEDYSTKITKDLPCNTHIYFKIRNRLLNMTVLCRSNDALLGCYGSNMVHFSILQEYLAARLNVGIGVYRQFSDSLHVYTDSPVWARLAGGAVYDPYADGSVRATVLVQKGWGEFERGLLIFFASRPSWWAAYRERWGAINDPFFRHTVLPMVYVWYLHKQKAGDMYTALDMIHGDDWRRACTEWINRRQPQQEENLGYR